MKKLTPFLLSSMLLFGAIACTESRTSQQAPASTEDQTEVQNKEEAQESQQDSTSETRKRQLESDIRAREERNNLTGGDADRADSDLESEVRSKLEANLPASALVVEAEDGTVVISGTVPTQEQYERIEPLAKEIKGVKGVNVKATVAQAQSENNQ